MDSNNNQGLEEALKQLHSLQERVGDCAESGRQTANFKELHSQLSQIETTLARILHDMHLRVDFDLLSTTARLLARAVDDEEVLAALLDGLKQTIPYDAAGIFLLRRGQDQDAEEISAQVIRGYHSVEEMMFHQKVDQGVLGWVVRNGEAEIVDDVRTDSRYIRARGETLSEMAAPIISKGAVIGAINLEADRVGAFKTGQLRFLESLANYAAIALDHAQMHRGLLEAERLERELDIARRIQVNLLPRKSPSIQGFDIAGKNIPSHGVGGDYYDFISVTKRDLGIVIGDVAGKGVPAGLVMAGLRGALRSKVETEYSIRMVLSQINRFLFDSTGQERFVTAVYGVLDCERRRFTYVNAGHNPPMLLRKDGSTEWLSTGGLLLGVLKDASYSEATISLKSGDILVLYTDGIIEAGGDVGKEYGEERLECFVKKHAGDSATKIANGVERAAVRFNRPGGILDDRTVIVVKCL